MSSQWIVVLVVVSGLITVALNSKRKWVPDFIGISSREFWPLAAIGFALGGLVRYFTTDRSAEQTVLFSLAFLAPFS
jgi:hypothetical protein